MIVIVQPKGRSGVHDVVAAIVSSVVLSSWQTPCLVLVVVGSKDVSHFVHDGNDGGCSLSDRAIDVAEVDQSPVVFGCTDRAYVRYAEGSSQIGEGENGSYARTSRVHSSETL